MNILVFSASLRKDSFNTKLAALAAEAARQGGDSTVELIRLNDYDMPAFSSDTDAAGKPEAVERFKKLLDAHPALIIASPEYNYSMPGHLKNLIDWISRYRPMPWSRKAILLMSASTSAMAGVRGLWQLRQPFEGCGAFVFPDMLTVAQAQSAFGPDGRLADARQMQRLQDVVKSFVAFVGGLKY